MIISQRSPLVNRVLQFYAKKSDFCYGDKFDALANSSGAKTGATGQWAML